MSQASRLRGRECLPWEGCIFRMLMLCIMLAAAPGDVATASGQNDVRSLDGGSAEVRFPTPARHAIVLQQADQVRALYGCGDVIVHPHEPGRALTVVRVEPRRLIVREGARGGGQVVRVGDPLPGVPGRTFAGTVLLDAVHYRYRRVERIVHLDPVLLAIEGSRALLEVEVSHPTGPAAGVPAEGTDEPVAGLGSPVRTTLDAALLSQVHLRESAPDRYDVRAADVQAVLENAGRVLAELAPGVVPTFSTTGGMEYRITSAAGDGVLGRQGFTVWAPKLAERAGIQLGDTILSVNGVPVDGFPSLFRIYQQVRRTPALATVQMEVERGGTRVTKTYRFR